jgi:hypothetical protein
MNGLPPLLERHVSRLVCDFLQAAGWRLIRNNVTKQKDSRGRWTQFGETGMPDFLALYYRGGFDALAMWLEFKRPKRGKLARHQELWHARERRDGAAVVTVDDYDSFRAFYAAAFDRPGSAVKTQRELITR